MLALVGLHNLSAEKLAAADALGGFAMPSIAVMRVGDAFDAYGDGTLVFAPSAWSPSAHPDNRLYAGDAWTPFLPGGDFATLDEAVARLRLEPERAVGSPDALAQRLDSLADAFAQAWRLAPPRAEAIRGGSDATLAAWREAVRRYAASRTKTGALAVVDLLAEQALLAAWRASRGDAERFAEEAQRDGFALDRAAAEAAIAALTAAIPFFEAKPRRAVGFGEVAAAVVPEGDAAVREILARRGTLFATYTTQQERQAAVRQAAEAAGAIVSEAPNA